MDDCKEQIRVAVGDVTPRSEAFRFPTAVRSEMLTGSIRLGEER